MTNSKLKEEVVAVIRANEPCTMKEVMLRVSGTRGDIADTITELRDRGVLASVIGTIPRGWKVTPKGRELYAV